MIVRNEHHRDFREKAETFGALLDALASPHDRLWPANNWPPMRFDRPLGIGATGGHGPIRYFVESYSPGRSIVFRFTGPQGFDGTHSFIVEPLSAGTRLTHLLTMKTSGSASFSWPLIFRPLHDALVEEALDRAATAVGEPLAAPPWSSYVRLLRAIVRRRGRQRRIAGFTSMDVQQSREKLITILQFAYSGELAAGLAYAGHWRSVSDPAERARIHAIEDEEWHHRALVGGMLRELGAAPDPKRERRATMIGRTLGAFCHVATWFPPMYGAGKLESRNIREYEAAAGFARDSANEQFIDCLLTMAEVEWEHEAYFRARVESHWLSRIVKVWPAPPPKEEIRRTFGSAAPTAPH